MDRMLKRALLAGWLICLAYGVVISPAHAQTHPKPTDVPTYVPQAKTYAAGVTLNVLGDGSDSRGGTPPYYATMPANIPVPTTTGRIVGGAQYCPTGVAATVGNSANCTIGYVAPESKLRLIFGGSHILFDDPERNFGQPGQSHCHHFFGNNKVNANSTYASLRNATGSTSAGDDVNNTGYWLPCFVSPNLFGDGKNYANKMDGAVGYYIIDPADKDKIVYLPRALRYVGGRNVDDPDGAGLAAIIATANAQSGTAGRYRVTQSADPTVVANALKYQGFVGYKCILANGATVPTKAGAGQDTDHSYSFKMADNSDPWDGGCVSGSQIDVESNGPGCWDGVNPWSPTGYDHVSLLIWDSVANAHVCPKNWYRFPQLILQQFISTTGPSHYMNMVASSDAMVHALTSGTDLPGDSAHFDWFMAWDDNIARIWQNSLGMYGNTPYELNYSSISTTQRLITDEPSPSHSGAQVDLTVRHLPNTPSNMFLLPSTTYTGMRGHSTH